MYGKTLRWGTFLKQRGEIEHILEMLATHSLYSPPIKHKENVIMNPNIHRSCSITLMCGRGLTLVMSLTLFGHERTKGRRLLYKMFFKCTRKFLLVCYDLGFRITLIFALCFQWVNLIDGEQFFKCEVELSYHLILSPLFWECHTMGLYPPYTINMCSFDI